MKANCTENRKMECVWNLRTRESINLSVATGFSEHACKKWTVSNSCFKKNKKHCDGQRKFPVYVPFLCSLRPFQIIHWNSSPLSRSKEIAPPIPIPGPEEVQLMNIPPQDILLLLKARLSANPPHPPPAPHPHPNHCTIDYYPALPLNSLVYCAFSNVSLLLNSV